MGNKIETIKLKQVITEISETTDINETLLKTEFHHLFEFIGNDINSINPFFKTLKPIAIQLSDDLLINFIKNLIDFLNIIIEQTEINDKDQLKIKISLLLLEFSIELMYEKFQNLREIIINSINKFINFDNTEKENELLSTSTNFSRKIPISSLRNYFPFNALYTCIDLFINNEEILNVDSLEIRLILSKIIYSIVYFQKVNDFIGKSVVEFFDYSKLLLSNVDKIFPMDKKNMLISKLFMNLMNDFNNLFLNNVQIIRNRNNIENIISYNFLLLLWICYDINNFFFKECNSKGSEQLEFYFENEFNEKMFKFLEIATDRKNIIELIQEYQKSNKEAIINTLIDNNKIFNHFMFNFFNNYEKFSNQFKLLFKIILIYICETHKDFCEVISLNKDCLKLILNKLDYNEYLDLIILNKLTMSNNFYIIIKFVNINSVINNSNHDNSNQENIQYICEKCLEAILLNRKGNLKLDSISYMLFLIINNLSSFLTEINSAIILKLGEFFTYFSDLEITYYNINDNIIVINLYLEILLNFLTNLESPASLLLVLLKLKEVMIKTNDKYYLFNTSGDAFNKYNELFKNIISILNKFYNKIEEEGANVKFTSNSELVKIINKISIDKSEFIYSNNKENKIFGTDTEKFLILNIYSFDNSHLKIFK